MDRSDRTRLLVAALTAPLLTCDPDQSGSLAQQERDSFHDASLPAVVSLEPDAIPVDLHSTRQPVTAESASEPIEELSFHHTVIRPVQFSVEVDLVLPLGVSPDSKHVLLADEDDLETALMGIRSGTLVESNYPRLPYAPQSSSVPGHFSLKTDAPGRYFIVAYGDGVLTNAETAITIAPENGLNSGGNISVKVNLIPGQEIFGTIVDATTGQRIQGAKLCLTPVIEDQLATEKGSSLIADVKSYGGFARKIWSNSDGSGTFTMTGVSSGNSTLRAYAEGFAPTQVKIQPSNRGPVELRLHPERQLFLQFVNSDTGKPFSHASVHGFVFTKFDDNESFRITLPGKPTDQDGGAFVPSLYDTANPSGLYQQIAFELFGENDEKLCYTQSFKAEDLISLANRGEPIRLTPLRPIPVTLDLPDRVDSAGYIVVASQRTIGASPKTIATWPLSNLNIANTGSMKFELNLNFLKANDGPTELALCVQGLGGQDEEKDSPRLEMVLPLTDLSTFGPAKPIEMSRDLKVTIR